MSSDNSLASKQDLLLDDEKVAEYLSANPDFFCRNEHLLPQLNIPHKSGGAVSLLERQINLLRDSNAEYQRKIDNFILHAQENDELFEKTRFIILEILRSSSLPELSSVIGEKLRKDFSASSSLLLFVSENPQNDEESGLTSLPLARARESLGDLFERKRAYCGSLAAEQTTLFFGEQSKHIVSAAIVPIHLPEHSSNEKLPGIPLLVIGSDKANHFNSKLDTLFLDFIGEVLAAHISRLVL